MAPAQDPASPAAEPQHRLLTPDELCAWLQVPKQTVYRWRTTGDGPRGFRVGKHLRYDPNVVEQWLEELNTETN